MNIPESFCGSTWNTIWNYVRTLAFSGSFPWFKEEDIGIACYAEGLKPIVFKLE
jgi:uncharacterized repeat protein (TIGR04076 family)